MQITLVLMLVFLSKLQNINMSLVAKPSTPPRGFYLQLLPYSYESVCLSALLNKFEDQIFMFIQAML
jgi:hypothetical protein